MLKEAMPLLSVFRSNPAAISEFSVEQVVSTAGDGVLRDGSVCSQEVRDYLAQISSDRIARYVEQCLSSRFEKSGMILQDLVNELGRRLDYTVENGRYQGVQNAVGFDGIWLGPEGGTIIAEIKTTDAYRVSLDTLIGYRERLFELGKIAGRASILIVVGRQDTGELEAQVRGSRHAWDIRLISAEALIKLVKLKENSDETETGRKIRSVLSPVEYTRLDRLVDVMFTTVSDVAQPVETEPESVSSFDKQTNAATNTSERADTASAGSWVFTDPALLEAKREAICSAMAAKLQMQLVKKSRALFWSADHRKRVACTISKRYTKRSSHPYWYAYHPEWNDWLQEADEGYVGLGCMDLPVAFAIPLRTIREVLPYLNTTTTHKTYWHVHITQGPSGQLELLLPKAKSANLNLSQFEVHLGEQTP
ncbi:MAG: hypothetical protein JOZ42_06855 [Acetobacteraceae bacterium]|nr:hypothetical protein [Acetobacteraceae bacterium]